MANSYAKWWKERATEYNNKALLHKAGEQVGKFASSTVGVLASVLEYGRNLPWLGEVCAETAKGTRQTASEFSYEATEKCVLSYLCTAAEHICNLISFGFEHVGGAFCFFASEAAKELAPLLKTLSEAYSTTTSHINRALTSKNNPFSGFFSSF